MIKILVAVMAFAISGTSVREKPDPSEATRSLAQPYEQFGFEMLRELAAKRPDGNIFISPTSVAVALAMTSNGAQGATRDAILATLHSGGQSIESFNAANRALV